MLSHYDKIPIWENKSRINRLFEFRDLVKIYSDNSEGNWKVDARIEKSKEGTDAREKINRGSNEFGSIMRLSGVSPIITWTPPPAVGGYVQRVDVITNFFRLYSFEIGLTEVIDLIDRSIGVYQKDQKRAWIRTFNPLFWAGLVVDYVVRIPFSLLAKAGFNQPKIEDSFIGRLAKFVLYVVTLTASFLTILQLTGYLSDFIVGLKRVWLGAAH